MKHSLWFTILLLVLFSAIHTTGYSAIANHHKTGPNSATNCTRLAEKKTAKSIRFREKIGKKINKFKQKIRHWKERIQLSFPSGKLLTSLVLLLLSITFFAIGGITIYGVLFNTLGSIAIIGALLVFILWLTERSKLPSPSND